jgi:hypothetical protein
MVTIRVVANSIFSIQDFQKTEEIEENIWSGRLLVNWPNAYEDRPITNHELRQRKRRENGWVSI